MTDIRIPARRAKEGSRDYAYRVLRRNIMSLILKPGDGIDEARLSEMLEMSRTPVHEAITALKNEWPVDIYPQKGTYVSRIDPAMVKEGYNARILLEADLLRDIAGKISHEQMARLLDCMHRSENLSQEDIEEIDDFIVLDDELHHMMYQFGNREHTWMVLQGLMTHYNRLRYLDAIEKRTINAEVQRQHRLICSYLLMGLPEGINTLDVMRKHLESFKGTLLARMEDHPGYFAMEQ